MTTPAPTDIPVYVSAYNPQDRDRQVRIVRHDGATITEPCSSQNQLEALVQQHRPGTDLNDPAQVHWADHPGEWSGI
ncbi:hypothetical protein ABIA32_000864 [Streptacidiphilus sp. MAP12-20]|uniref:hypothetical protein n=1 Tax=Streptacidiphilus sp. MAP12-20 TaxID=3156299 RepID=UPI00351162F8